MLIKFPNTIDAHIFSIGTLLNPKTQMPDRNEPMVCQRCSINFPEDSRSLCELDGVVGAHNVIGLLSEDRFQAGAMVVRATHPFYDPSANPHQCWLTISQIKLIGNEKTAQIDRENLFASSLIVNSMQWARHAPNFIPSLPMVEFTAPDYTDTPLMKRQIIKPQKIELEQRPPIELADLPFGVGLLLGALSSGYPGHFGLESFSSIDEFLTAVSYTIAILPAPLRHTVSFAYGFERSQPICALQYFTNREVPKSAIAAPIAAMPVGSHLEMSLPDVRSLLAERLKTTYNPSIDYEDTAEFDDDDDIFEDDNLFHELTGLARETTAALGQILNEIGIHIRPASSQFIATDNMSDQSLIGFDALLSGQDCIQLIPELYSLFSEIDGAPESVNKLIDRINQYFPQSSVDLATTLVASIRDEPFATRDSKFLLLLNDLLTFSQSLPNAEPFLEYRTRIIEGAADGLRQYITQTKYLTPEQLVKLSEFEQISDLVACILETGDWVFTQSLNISFTIFALAGDGYPQDAANLAKRLLPPSVVAHQWIHALLNSRALVEAFEALISTPDSLPLEKTLFIIQAMTDLLARTGRKDVVLEHITRLSMNMLSQQNVDFTKIGNSAPLDEDHIIRLRIMTLLSDNAERFYASSQHARLVLSR